jgi:hypothetical protein
VSKKLKIRKRLEAKSWEFRTTLDTSDFEGLLDDTIKRLVHLREQYAGQAIGLDYEQIPWEDAYTFYLYEEREETDEEYADRVAKEKERRQAIEAQELAEFQRLQEKFAPRR